MQNLDWTEDKVKAALSLAEGYTRKEAAATAGVSERTIYNWLDDPEFSTEVDRLSLMVGVAAKAERLRIVSRVIRQKIRDAGIETDKDLLDWLKFAQGETDGVKLDLLGLLDKATDDS